MNLMREVVACVVWLVAGAVIIAAMFTHTTVWVAVPIVLGAVAATAIALPGAPKPPPAGTVHNCNDHADHAGRP